MTIKQVLYLVPFLGIFLSISQKTAESCPTCVGKITDKTAPFFTDECYTTDLDATDFANTNTN